MHFGRFNSGNELELQVDVANRLDPTSKERGKSSSLLSSDSSLDSTSLSFGLLSSTSFPPPVSESSTDDTFGPSFSGTGSSAAVVVAANRRFMSVKSIDEGWIEYRTTMYSRSNTRKSARARLSPHLVTAEAYASELKGLEIF